MRSVRDVFAATSEADLEAFAKDIDDERMAALARVSPNEDAMRDVNNRYSALLVLSGLVKHIEMHRIDGDIEADCGHLDVADIAAKIAISVFDMYRAMGSTKTREASDLDIDEVMRQVQDLLNGGE